MSTGYRSLDLQQYKQGCELISCREYQGMVPVHSQSDWRSCAQSSEASPFLHNLLEKNMCIHVFKKLFSSFKNHILQINTLILKSNTHSCFVS